MRFERWCGFGQVPSDGVHFVPVLSDGFDGLWFFSAALVGPIANLNAAPFSESNADAGRGIAIATAHGFGECRWHSIYCEPCASPYVP
jgi:hypothetical protein